MVDTQTAAVIGTLDSQGARASIPLLNEAGFLHVSLGAGYAGFTRRVAADEPERWFPAGGRTFARLVGDDRAQAPALVRAAGARRIVVEAEGGEDGAALATEIRRAATAAGVKVVSEPGRDGAVIYAGEDPLAAASVAESVIAETPGTRVVLPDEAVRNGVEGRLSGPDGPAHRARLARARAGLDARAARVRGGLRARLRAPPRPVRRARPRGDGDGARRARRGGRRERRAAPPGLREYFSGRPRETVAGPLTVLGSGAVSPRASPPSAGGRTARLPVPLALQRRVQLISTLRAWETGQFSFAASAAC